MKKLIKKVARIFGIQISLYRPTSSSAAQLSNALNKYKIDMVFDIGANQGQFAKEIRAHGYNGKIISFEPLTSARTSLSKNAKNDTNWIIHEQCAIGDYDGQIEINISGNSVSSSVLKMLELHSSAAVGSAYIGNERVQITRLDNISSKYLSDDSKLFIKIDTQGFEWQVLEGAVETLKHTSIIQIELSLIPLYDGQRLWREIVDHMDSLGFMLWALQNGFTDSRTGQTLQVDGIFINQQIE